MKFLLFSIGFFCASSYAQITPVGESLSLNREDSSFVKQLSCSLEINAPWRNITSFVFKYAEECFVITYIAPTQQILVVVKNYEVGDIYYASNGEIDYYPIEHD